MLVEGCEDLDAPKRRGAPPGALQPIPDAGSCRQTHGLGAEQFGDADPRLRCVSKKARVHLIVEITDLHGSWH